MQPEETRTVTDCIKDHNHAKLKVLSSGVVQLLLPLAGKWNSRGIGICCIVKDSEKKSFFIVVVDMDVSSFLNFGSPVESASSTRPTSLQGTKNAKS